VLPKRTFTGPQGTTEADVPDRIATTTAIAGPSCRRPCRILARSRAPNLVGKPHFLYERPPARIVVQPAQPRRSPDHAHARIALRAGPLEPGKGLIPLATVRENLRDLKGGRVRAGRDELLERGVRLRAPPLRMIDVREREQPERDVNLAFCRVERLAEPTLGEADVAVEVMRKPAVRTQLE